MRCRPAVLVAVATTVLLLAGCAGGPSVGSETDSSAVASSASPRAGSGTVSGDLTVFAAASLAASFGELAAEFRTEHPKVTVKPIVFDGSSTLATQLIEGASADVFASADQANMTKVLDAGELDGAARSFATNTLEIAVQPGNPDGIRTLSDLAAPRRLVVLCAPQVPCGAASKSLLALNKVKLTPVSEEQNVTAVLTKVAAGEADAGLVYKTDIAASDGRVDAVPAANADQAVNRYEIGQPSSTTNQKAGAAFIEFVTSASGQAILHKYGFGRP
ncbi:MAG: molybdate ABC transporter substrate-binding protein [Microbacteriaceae bacterium]